MRSLSSGDSAKASISSRAWRRVSSISGFTQPSAVWSMASLSAVVIATLR